ncbi:MAG: ABC transporter permease [Firmicutes bacterium]|jgi:ribose transport system permease protein|nr:ABC transporter permease [Bacillota bacterium]
MGVAEPRTKQNPWTRIRAIQNKYPLSTLFVVIIAMWVVLAILSPYFFTYHNMFNLGRQTALTAIISVGMTFVIISGGIDLSVGSIVGVSSVVVSLLMVNGMPIWLAILLTLLMSCVLGLISGIAIYDAKVPPFIATLGMMSAARGLALMFSQGRTITNIPRPFTQFAQATVVGIPSLFLVALIVAVLGVIILNRTQFGRNVYAMGSSKEVARLSGINMRTNTYGIYVLSAALSSLAGILMTSRLASGIPTSGQGDEMDAIASVVIGGASLAGAEGSIVGTMIGALIMATLRNGFNLLGIDPFWMRIAIGILIVVAVFVDQFRKAD